MIYAEVISFKGEKKEKAALPAKIFGVEIKPALMAQAVRVFLSNQRKARARAKTRGEVERTKAKWYRQKGTGRARHGARSAPIFVGGGKAHGPRGEQNYKMAFPKKMNRASIASALSVKAKEKKVIILEGLEKIQKTKELKAILRKNSLVPSLLVLSEKLENVILSARNIQELKLIRANSLNAYEILKAKKILLTKEAIKILEEQWGKD